MHFILETSIFVLIFFVYMFRFCSVFVIVYFLTFFIFIRNTFSLYIFVYLLLLFIWDMNVELVQ